MKADCPYVYELVPSAIGEVGIVRYCDGGRPRIRRTFLPEAGVVMADRVRQEFPGVLPASGRSETAERIGELLSGRVASFSIAELDLEGMNGFVRRTLTACREIPRGRVMTYGGLAVGVGIPGGARAVGNAMALNPFALIIPCHRVIRSGGGLGGFGGGLPMKRALLAMEEVAFDKRGRVRPEHILG